MYNQMVKMWHRAQLYNIYKSYKGITLPEIQNSYTTEDVSKAHLGTKFIIKTFLLSSFYRLFAVSHKSIVLYL